MLDKNDCSYNFFIQQDNIGTRFILSSIKIEKCQKNFEALNYDWSRNILMRAHIRCIEISRSFVYALIFDLLRIGYEIKGNTYFIYYL